MLHPSFGCSKPGLGGRAPGFGGGATGVGGTLLSFGMQPPFLEGVHVFVAAQKLPKGAQPRSCGDRAIVWVASLTVAGAAGKGGGGGGQMKFVSPEGKKFNSQKAVIAHLVGSYPPRVVP
eukprot:2035940-Rhodomonas_salina.2